MRSLLAGALGFALALLLFHFLRSDPEIRYREVIVADTVLIRGEPDTVVRWRERIVYRTVAADQVATTPGAALPDIASFCGSAGWVRTPPTAGDTLPRVPAVASSVLLLRSFSYDNGDLTLMGPRSDGDLWRGDYRVGRRFQGRVMGDSVFVQTHRWDGLRTWGGRLLWMAGGAAAGYAAHTFGVP